MEAIILAGGFGKRLRPVVRDVPKPMADINGRPFLSYLMDYLSGQNVKKVLLSVGYMHEVIRDYFGLKYKAIAVEYVVEDEPLGTGGAIREALRYTSADNVVVLNGDTLFAVNLKEMVAFHLSKGSTLTIALKPMRNFDRYGTAILKDDRVVGFQEKSFQESGYINGGVFVINRAIAGHLNRYGKSFSFEADFLQEEVADINSFAFISDDYFIDIGIPEDYEKAMRQLGIAGINRLF